MRNKMNKLAEMGITHLDGGKYYGAKELFPTAVAFATQFCRVMDTPLDAILPHVITGYMLHKICACDWQGGGDDNWWAYDYEGPVWLMHINNVGD